MKKYWYRFLTVILAIFIIGCSKDDPVDPNPPVVEPKEYFFTDLWSEFYEIVPEDRFGPTLVQIYIICVNENQQRMGDIVTITTSSSLPLYIYDTRTDPVQTSFETHVSWSNYSQGEARAVVNIVPQVGEFDFVLTTTQPQGYIPGFEDPVIIHESTPPLHLKMWQEGDDWKAELTTKKN